MRSAVRCTELSEQDWAAVDPEGHAFANVNTPEDAARLGALLP
jgi:molybdopterin-guanine dinucleotide biosynthesis protein A